MIACVNASPQFAVESTRTLEFAMGVAKIKNRPTALLTPHEKLIKDLKEQIRQLKIENMMLRARTPGYFLEHPNHEVDPSVMLSDRRDENIDHSIRQQHHTNIGFLHPPEDAVSGPQQNDPNVRKKIVQIELQTLKQKPQLRRRSKSPKKKRILKRMPASLISKHSLPPVAKRTPPQRSLQINLQLIAQIRIYLQLDHFKHLYNPTILNNSTCQ
ncbi:Kinesin-like protein [Phytophthora cinnamomi]|uniref:Kinesin-like protein n=1 Tax=Phytophthora cinnamomi TaxID=4785 RepID=UPI003559CF8A|nr:Kinesin-like protein [Phytophthora cinnamomi]